MKTRLVLALLLLPAALPAQEAEAPRTLTVAAQGTVERTPDQAVLSLAVESESGNARDAARNNASKMERVLNALRRAGLPADRIRTTAYQLHPVYARQERPEEPPRISGYRAINQLQVVIEALDRVGPALDAAIDAGANRASNLQFQLKDPGSARLEALKLATAKARSEAEAVAAAAGEVLGPIQSISTDSWAPSPRPMEYARAMAMERADTPVEAGTLGVTASVSITYRLGR